MIQIQNTATLSGHQNPIYTVENSQKKGIFFTAGNDKGVVEWSSETLGFIKVLFPVISSVYSLHSPISVPLLLAGERNGQVDVFNFEEQRISTVLHFHKLPVFDIKSVASKNEVLLSSEDGSVSVWDLTDLKMLYSFKVSDAAARVITISQDEKTVAFGCKDNTIRVYDLKDYSLLYVLDQHTMPISSLQFSPDGKQLISGSRDAQLKVWSTVDYSLIQSIPAHLFAIYSITFHPVLPYLATASRDKSIKIWDTENFDLKKTISIEKGYDCHHLSINKIIWEPINNQLISVSDDKLLKIWKVEFGR